MLIVIPLRFERKTHALEELLLKRAYWICFQIVITMFIFKKNKLTQKENLI